MSNPADDPGNESDHSFMSRAIELSLQALEDGGGPFGAVVVKDGKIVGEGKNRVTIANDPTAHAEIQAIRNACSAEQTFRLAGCRIFSSCEPCPMCLGAILWAHLDTLCYANSRYDAAEAGFDDASFYRQLEANADEGLLKTRQLMQPEAFKVFQIWLSNPERIKY